MFATDGTERDPTAAYKFISRKIPEEMNQDDVSVLPGRAVRYNFPENKWDTEIAEKWESGHEAPLYTGKFRSLVGSIYKATSPLSCHRAIFLIFHTSV